MTRAPTEMESRAAVAVVRADQEWYEQTRLASEGRGKHPDEPHAFYVARAVIRAMREPTQDMIEAWGAMSTEAEVEWAVGIDAASPPEDA